MEGQGPAQQHFVKDTKTTPKRPSTSLTTQMLSKIKFNLEISFKLTHCQKQSQSLLSSCTLARAYERSRLA
jgi:hypothetical protein